MSAVEPVIKQSALASGQLVEEMSSLPSFASADTLTLAGDCGKDTEDTPPGNNMAGQRFTGDSEKQPEDLDLVPVLDVFPEGGSRAIMSVVGGFAAISATFSQSNTWGVFQDELSRVRSVAP